MKEIFYRVFEHKGKLYTLNSTPGFRVYGEELIKIDGKEYREWDPYRSKAAGAIKKGLKHFPVDNSTILYLGASTGTTISHFADITINPIFGVEVSEKMLRSLLTVSDKKTNIIPILADARKPDMYEEIGSVDLIYEDVAQPDQARILKINAKKFLRKNGYAMFCVKSRSIDVSKDKEHIFEDVKEELKDMFNIVEEVELFPYDKDHIFLVLQKR